VDCQEEEGKKKKKESYRTTKAHGANVKYKHGVGL
jgi:hypothetical protein